MLDHGEAMRYKKIPLGFSDYMKLLQGGATWIDGKDF